MTTIKREDVGAISKALNECNYLLSRRNLYSSIVRFREALEKMMHTPMLPADEKELNAMVNSFQEKLSSSRVFYESYGPVTFRDNDIETAADFMRQLMEIKEEEIREEMEKVMAAEAAGISADLLAKANEVRIVIERGDYSVAREMIGNNEDLLEYIVSLYNEKGIEARKATQYDLAISEFRKIVSLCPEDEGLYYNLARAYIEKKEWVSAEETIAESLVINESFALGLKLLAYIKANKPDADPGSF